MARLLEVLLRNIVPQKTSTTDDSDGEPSTRYRHPAVGDGAAVWELVRESGVLDVNSCYAYLLICRDFSATSMVATRHDRLVGFVTGYRPPSRPNVLFIWQIGVHSDARKSGIAKSLLRELLSSGSCRGVDCIEATIAPSNQASRRLFRSFADELGGSLVVQPGFTEADFGAGHHEPEETVRIELQKQIED